MAKGVSRIALVTPGPERGWDHRILITKTVREEHRSICLSCWVFLDSVCIVLDFPRAGRIIGRAIADRVSG